MKELTYVGSQKEEQILAELAKEEQIQGGTLKVGFSSCGDSSYHGKVTSLSPQTMTIGQKTHMTGKGSVDETVTGGTFTITMKVGWFTRNYDGDFCQSKTFSLPAGLGTVTWNGMKCPASPGDVAVGVDVQMSSMIPSSMSYATIEAKASASNGDKLICMQIKTAPAESAIVV